MCGRYASTRNPAELTALFDAMDETDGGLAPDFNIAPTDSVPIVRVSRRLGSRVLSAARWGLVPPWATDSRIAARMINARVETVATSTAYAPSFARRRCLVPADGWYEWVRREVPPAAAGRAPGAGSRGGRRQAYFMTPQDGSVVVFAGLWTVSGAPPNQRLTCSIVTAPAVGELAAVHDRMPLLLPAERWPAWLAAAPDDPELLAPTPGRLVAGLEIRPVSAAVGDVRNDGPSLIERAEPSDDTGRPDAEVEALRLF